MKKSKTQWFRALAILGIAAAVWSVAFTIDAVRAANDQTPICCFKLTNGNGTPYKVYVGLFYKVYFYDNVEACIPEDPTCGHEPYQEAVIHPWFYQNN